MSLESTLQPVTVDLEARVKRLEEQVEQLYRLVAGESVVTREPTSPDERGGRPITPQYTDPRDLG